MEVTKSNKTLGNVGFLSLVNAKLELIQGDPQMMRLKRRLCTKYFQFLFLNNWFLHPCRCKLVFLCKIIINNSKRLFLKEISGFTSTKVCRVLIYHKIHEINICNKLKFSNPFVSATSWRQYFIFQTINVRRTRFHYKNPGLPCIPQCLFWKKVSIFLALRDISER